MQQSQSRESKGSVDVTPLAGMQAHVGMFGGLRLPPKIFFNSFFNLNFEMGFFFLTEHRAQLYLLTRDPLESTCLSFPDLGDRHSPCLTFTGTLGIAFTFLCLQIRHFSYRTISLAL